MSALSVIESIKKLKKGKIIGTDINSKEQLALYNKVNIFYRVPTSNCEDYIKKILNICVKENISLVIPLTDPEVDKLNENRFLFESKSIKLCIPDSDVIKICRSKLNLYNSFKSKKIVNTINTQLLDSLDITNINYPSITKPEYGRSSIGFFKINDSDDLAYISKKRKGNNYIVQPYIPGEIHVVDLLNDNHKKNYAATYRKEIIRSNNGAGLSVKMLKDEKLKEIVKEIASDLKLNGFISLEFIKNNNDFFLMDINPRFSGGIAFSKATGYDIALNTVKFYLGLKIEKQETHHELFINKIYRESIFGK